MTGQFAIPGWMEIPAEHLDERVETHEDGSLTVDVYFQAKEDHPVLVTWELRATDNREVYLSDADGDSVLILPAHENNMRVYRIASSAGSVREGHSHLHVFVNGRRSSRMSVWRNSPV
jgi:hypothetical protein